MAKNLPWVKEYPTDELKEIALMSLVERGAYFTLKLIYHTNPDAFSNEQILFAMCLAFDEQERAAVRTVVKRLFSKGGNFPFNERLDNLEEQAVVGINQKRQAGIKSGEARRLKRTAVRTILESESELELDIELEKKKVIKKKITLQELSVGHVQEWLVAKRKEGKYIFHDEHQVLEVFKDYCLAKGKKYSDYIAAYRNAFEWERFKNVTKPKLVAETIIL